MEDHAGIDVSLELSSVCVVDGAGRIVREAKVPGGPEALVRFFAQLGVVVTRIGLEAGAAIALGPLRANADRGSTRDKIKRAAWDESFLLKLLRQS